MACATEFERAVAARSPARRHSTICENRARAWIDVELGRDIDRALQVVRPGAEIVGQREQDAADLLRLLFLERDDVVVDLDGLERLDEEARAAGRAAVDDSGNRGSMFGAHHQHVAAVAIGDDLLLQVFRRLPAAEKRSSVVRSFALLAAQPLADARQRGARVVGDVAGRIDLSPDVRDFALERRDALDQLR